MRQFPINKLFFLLPIFLIHFECDEFATALPPQALHRQQFQQLIIQQPMTYFTRSKRVLTEEKYESLDPCSYSKLNMKSPTKAYAPFGSLKSKMGSEKKEMLGPGSYEIQRDIVQPCITKYQNRNVIVVKINDEGSCPFKSQTNRFASLNHLHPGPGTYDVPHAKTKSLPHRNTLTNKIRKINQLLYQQLRQPTLLSDPVSTENNSTPKQPKGVKWELNQKQRFSPIIKQQFSTADKSKAIEMVRNKVYPTKPTAAFASKSLKSHLQAQIYQSSNPFKVQLRKEIDFKDDAPGPGSYEMHAIDHPKPKFQFFGSTVERFPSTDTLSEVGPGRYEVVPTPPQPIPPKESKPTKEERHSYIPNCADAPGPGHYDLQSTSLERRNDSFGSNQPRFSEEKIDPTEPTEVFEVNEIFKQKMLIKEAKIKLRNIVLNHHQSSIFKSKSDRFDHTVPSSPSYDVSLHDINTRVMKQRKSQEQFQNCNLHRPPFMSSIARFSNKEKQEDNTHKDCWCQMKTIEKQHFQRESPSFATKEKRTVVFNSAKDKTPPVGAYSKRGTFVRNSFNAKFIRQGHQKEKKMLLWKQSNVYVNGNQY